jgi:hypothetical protein
MLSQLHGSAGRFVVSTVARSLVVAACLSLVASPLLAAEKGPRLKAGQYNPAHESVEMFAAVEAELIYVRFIPKDDTQGRIIIENKTDRPLNVELPAAFAAAPADVLGQFGGGGRRRRGGGGGNRGGGGGGFGGGQQGGGNQGMGGGGGGGGGFGGGGGGGGGGGFFNVAAEKVANVKVPCVCLEHGKDNPRPAIPYEIMPIADFNGDPNVWTLCALLGQGRIDQRAAQAAAWHLANNMSWQELASKRIERLDGSSTPYFSQDEIFRAVHVVEAVDRLVKESSSAPATGAPATGAPATGAPATGAPATGAPESDAPATGALPKTVVP